MRSGKVTLHIEHRDPELTVETTVIRGSVAPRHAEQRYTTDRKVSVSTGADGDEFLHPLSGVVRGWSSPSRSMRMDG